MVLSWPRRLLRYIKKISPSTMVKLGGVAVAVTVTLLPLLFWPTSAKGPDHAGGSQTVIAVPPLAQVTDVLPGDATTTTLPGNGSTPVTDPSVGITIAAVGDIIIHNSVLEAAYDGSDDAYDFGDMIAPIAPYLSCADYTVCNLESQLVGPVTDSEAEDVLRFGAPRSLTAALTSAGIDLAATANNHATDFGWTGIKTTLDRLDQADISHVGTARSLSEKRKPFMVEIEGIKVAFINYTAFVNDSASIEARSSYAVNILRLDEVADEAAAARADGADIVVALLHYGTEFLRNPTVEQMRITEGAAGEPGLLLRGVDVILGTHPHVVQPIVKVVRYSGDDDGDAYAAYSLGNFLTGQRWRYTDSGIVAYIHIEKEGSVASVTGMSYLPFYVQKSGETIADYRILPVLPGLAPQTDTEITAEEQARMNQVWNELENLLYRPDEGIVPLVPVDVSID